MRRSGPRAVGGAVDDGFGGERGAYPERTHGTPSTTAKDTL